MSDYLLFIDTETSGLPKSWEAPYSAKDNWPSALQVSWIVYTKDGKKIKEENKYIYEADVEISPSSIKIHGIERHFLRVLGEPRKDVLTALTNDLNKFNPLVIGHFIELDFHVLSADFYRLNAENPLAKLSTFCTMVATSHLMKNPQKKFLKLGELYELLFNKPLLNQHNALYDVTATADCFFELIKIKEINSLDQPPIKLQRNNKAINALGWLVIILIVILLIMIIAFNK